jgi:hypothetical protein
MESSCRVKPCLYRQFDLVYFFNPNEEWIHHFLFNKVKLTLPDESFYGQLTIQLHQDYLDLFKSKLYLLIDYYVLLRHKMKENVKILNTLIKLATSHAFLDQRKECHLEDVLSSIVIMDQCEYVKFKHKVLSESMNTNYQELYDYLNH